MSALFSAVFEGALAPVLQSLRTATGHPCLVGPHGPSLGLVLAYLIQHGPRDSATSKGTREAKANWLILTPTEDEAESLYQDLLFFHRLLQLPADPVNLFPHSEPMVLDKSSSSIDLTAQRMRTLLRLARGLPTIVVASTEAILEHVIPVSKFRGACLEMKPGTTIEREALAGQMLNLGYRRVSVVEIPGEFSMRGGIVDIYSTAYDNPLRVEFLGDTVESLRFFDADSQDSIGKTSSGWLLPARNLLVPVHAGQETKVGSLPNTSGLSESGGRDSTGSLVDYWQSVPIVVFDRPQNLAHTAEEWWNSLIANWEGSESGEPAETKQDPYHLYGLWSEVIAAAKPCPQLDIEAIAPSDTDRIPTVTLSFQSPATVGLGIRGTAFADTLAILEPLRASGVVLIIARNQGQVGRLLSLFGEYQAPAAEWNPQHECSTTTARFPFFVLQGEVSASFVTSDGTLAVITEEDLFAKAAKYRPHQKTKAGTFFSSLEDLRVGDYVVHVQHGIARYDGLRRLSVQGFDSDYLILQFAGRDTLYVPLDRLNHVQRYRGADHQAPKLDKLGGTSWARTTARVKKGIEDMAHELVQLYASREIVERKSYREDSTLAHEFEAAFEYEETPDQIQAIADIQKDLESSKPMDRLICGDVGYGKTEVAMRAAFTAVQDNRQVAVLVPTTLLAQQHYETFNRRFSAFPIRIAVLSRFQTSKEVKVLLPDLASGVIDIVIGTHRLLQNSVKFKNLGLVIIDEEQWFGVRHKERLKQLRTQVDVLTLTATPIPRTLQMAFSGVRDLSVIETPPAGRLAVRTHIMRFDPHVIREAIRRELARGGQVFYVHNRVQTIERTGTWVQELAPEARVLIAHGQMSERLLESVMLKFFHGEADVLVASAIIQSGLDLPRANTILVDRADTFGLAQLYQLRGRVGRAGDQAYAYFFFPNEEVLSADAQKRLLAIQEFAELGSGFRIAAADLEIRGAGNLLGKQQSGNIAAVGLDLYMRMVEEAVLHLKGQEIEVEIEPTLHLNVSAYIPEDYVEDGHQRLAWYKRLSNSQQIGELALLHGEIQDRYGLLPEPVERLFEVMQIRVLAKQLHLESVDARGGSMALTFHQKAVMPEAGIRWLIDHAGARLRFPSPRSCEIKAGPQDWPGVVKELNTILQGLKSHAAELVALS